MKKYSTPELEVVFFTNEDIIVTSGELSKYSGESGSFQSRGRYDDDDDDDF